MVRLIKFFDRYFEESICVVLMSAIAIVLGLQVFMRYVVHQSLGWSEEFARYCFVWLVFMGISYGAKMMKHITIDAGLMCFPKFFRKYVVILGNILFLLFSVWIVFLSFDLVMKQMAIEQLSPAMRIPIWILYAAPFVGFVLTSLRTFQSILYHVKRLHSKDSDATGVNE